MKVEWSEFYEPRHAEDFEDWQPMPPTKYTGEVINAVRTFGETKLVVMRNDGRVVQIPIGDVRHLSEGEGK